MVYAVYKITNLPIVNCHNKITINASPEIILNAIKQILAKIYFIEKTQDIMDYFLARASASAKK